MRPSASGQIVGDGGANQVFRPGGINRVAFTEVSGSGDLGIKAGVERAIQASFTFLLWGKDGRSRAGEPRSERARCPPKSRHPPRQRGRRNLFDKSKQLRAY